MKSIAIIIPCYQNEGSIVPLCERLLMLRERLREKVTVRFVFVNDGSTDRTLELLLNFRSRQPEDIKVVSLTRNFGSYNAFLAGMEHSVADCHVYLHADLQDPPELIDELFGHWVEGERLVIAYRSSREDGSLFSSLYHVLVRHFAIRNIPPGGFDLVLFDEQIRQEVVNISEKSTNIVYLISWLGYPYKAIPYIRKKRVSGVSQWRFSSKIRLFFDTFFSFTDLPKKVVMAIGIFSVVVATSALTVATVHHLVEPLPLHTWLLVSLLCVLSMVAVAAVILCEYLVRIHETVRKRPNTVVDRVYS